MGNAVNIGGLVPHLPQVVAAEVVPANVVALQDEDVGFLVCHLFLPFENPVLYLGHV